MIPPTNSPTPKVVAPNIVVPSAIPPPPAAMAPPPKAARVAFVAATPLKDAMAVPVDAVPNAITADVVAPAAANPPNVPAAAPPTPPKSTPAPTETVFNSSLSYVGRLTPSLLYCSNLGLF